MDIPGLEAVITAQQQILSQVYNISDISSIPQMWCLCKPPPLLVIESMSHDRIFTDKEVEGYYEAGMTVPDDVTLLWTDDKCVLECFRFNLELTVHTAGAIYVVSQL